MDASKFDPSGYYELRLDGGALATRDGARSVALPASILARLVARSDRDAEATLKAWGTELGAQALAIAGQRLDGLSPEAAAEAASLALGLAGLGTATLERFGDVVALRVRGGLPLENAPMAYGALLEGLFESISEAEVACVAADEDRFVVVHPSIADEVRAWVAAGAGAGEIAARLAAEADE